MVTCLGVIGAELPRCLNLRGAHMRGMSHAHPKLSLRAKERLCNGAWLMMGHGASLLGTCRVDIKDFRFHSNKSGGFFGFEGYGPCT